MKPGILVSSVLTVFLLGFYFFGLASAQTASPAPAPLTRDELAAQIQIKAKQLDDINQQLESTKQNLKATTAERLTLQRELNTLQNNIDQLNLGIKSDEISVQKLGLEIESLGYDIQDIQSSVGDKRTAIEKILLELQKNDRVSNNLLMFFLQGNSLADTVLEAQSLSNLQNQLTADIANLRNLNDEYNNKIQEATSKRGDIAFHQQNLKNRQLIVNDQKQERQVILTTTKNKESVFAQQVSDLEKLQQQVATEVEALDAVLRTKIDPATLPALGTGVLAMPIDGDKTSITQGYGATAFAKNGYVGHWHNGVDFGQSIGAPVYAAEDGTVAAVGNQDSYCYRGAYGRFIVINHNDNLTTLYAHLSRQIVQKGDTVKRGQVIGYVGRTGYATGPHLHFTVFAQPTFYMGPSKVCGPMPYGGDLNPLGYL